jgi:superfamily II DNA or RNA helicase
LFSKAPVQQFGPRVRFDLVEVDDRGQLGLKLSYIATGKPVWSMPLRISESERLTVAGIFALPKAESAEDAIFRLEGEDAASILAGLIRSDSLTFEDDSSISESETLTAAPQWVMQDDGTQIFVLVPDLSPSEIYNAGIPVRIAEGKLSRILVDMAAHVAVGLVRSGPLSPEQSASLAEAMTDHVTDQSIAAKPTPIAVKRQMGRPKKRITFERDGDKPVARITADYEGALVGDLGEGGEARAFDPETNTVTVIKRNVSAEKRILKEAAEQGLNKTDAKGVMTFAGADADVDAALFQEQQSERLASEGWTISEAANWAISLRRISQLELNIAIGAHEHDYQLDIFEGDTTSSIIEPLAEMIIDIPEMADDIEAAAFLQRYVRNGEVPMRSETGEILLLKADDFISLGVALRRILMSRRGYGSAPVDLGSLADLANLSMNIGLTAPDGLLRLLNAMRVGEQEQILYPACFVGEQDDRQLAAARWMRTLFNHGYGGILADGTGFGKTTEIMLHIASLREAGLLDEGALLVVPSAALEKIHADIAKNFDGLPVHMWWGKSRPTPEVGDIVITTHDLIHRSSCPLSDRRWTIVALDEAQDAKNAKSHLAKSIAAIEAVQKIPMTATPIENSYDDLYTLMSIANPGVFGTLPAFHKVFTSPIMDDADVVAANRLNALTSPFILARYDDKIPTPVVHEINVEMTKAQTKTYSVLSALKRKRFEKKLDDVRKSGRGAAQLGMSIMLSMTRERQLSCNPLLMPGGVSGPVSPYKISPKTKAIVDKAADLVDQGKRIIVFSSWTSHLDLLGSVLRQHGMTAVHYDGRMNKADKRVAENKFKAGDAQIILMTTKSGGRSLDFNEADAIFFAEPWWNPMVERQGIGRATRRNQTKVIEVYRFVMNSPIENFMMAKHRRKSGLSEIIMPHRTVELCDGITIEDIEQMLGCFESVSEELAVAA